MRRSLAALLFLLLPTSLFAQGIAVKGGASSDLANVNTAKSLEVIDGKSVRATYVVTATGLVTTAAYNLSVEASAGTGFKVYQICVGVSNATSVALVTVNVNRRTTASSAGTACTAESTTTCAMSKLDPADGNFGGVARTTSTLGTIGALLDGWGFTIGEISAGTADTVGLNETCHQYGIWGLKPIVVSAGTGNGVSVTVTAPGAGGLASGSITMMLVAE